MNKIHAVYENGVFRPTVPVELPEHCEVEFEPTPVGRSAPQRTLDDVYGVLLERYTSDESDVSARHNEHQP